MRCDTLWAVNSLAREVTRWNTACDKRLHRLISYLHHTSDWTQVCWVGDHPDDCNVAVFVDAGFAGDIHDSKSTTGAFVVLIGPHTFVPLTWICKKHGCVSHSSTEAEAVALEASVRTEGLPVLTLWECIQEVLGSDSKPQEAHSCRPHSPPVQALYGTLTLTCRPTQLIW